MPVAIALLVRDREVLMIRRTTAPLAGQWEFPGGKVRAGEAPLDALRREVREELHWSVETFEPFGEYSHAYALPDGEIRYALLAYTGRPPDRPVPRGAAFVGREEIRDLDVVAGSRPIVDDLVDFGVI